LGRYFDVNPVLYRVGFVVLALLGGAGLLIYLAAALVIPDEGEDQSIVDRALRERRRRPWQLIGLVLVVVSAMVLLSQPPFWNAPFGWVLALVAGLVLLALGPHYWSVIHTPSVDAPSGDAVAGDVGPGDPPGAPPPTARRSFPLASAVLGG